MGWYGDSGERPVTEEGAAAGEDFASELCLAWEQIAREAEKLGTRVVLLRTGLVLAPEGGFLGRCCRSTGSAWADRWVTAGNGCRGFISRIKSS